MEATSIRIPHLHFTVNALEIFYSSWDKRLFDLSKLHKYIIHSPARKISFCSHGTLTKQSTKILIYCTRGQKRNKQIKLFFYPSNTCFNLFTKSMYAEGSILKSRKIVILKFHYRILNLIQEEYKKVS